MLQHITQSSDTATAFPLRLLQPKSVHVTVWFARHMLRRVTDNAKVCAGFKPHAVLQQQLQDP